MQTCIVDTPVPNTTADAVEIPRTLLEAVQFYANPDVATKALSAARWAEGPECQHCHTRDRHSYISTRRIWKCRACRKQFSPKAGTIFEDSPITLDRWLIAVWVVANSEQRVSSYKLHRLLGVTQTTAQFMLRRIRLAIDVCRANGETNASMTAIPSQ